MIAPVMQDQAAASVPAADGFLFMAILLSGAAAAYVAMPTLWIVTPVVAALVYFSARRAASVQVSAALSGELPPHVQHAIDVAIDRLPLGEARRLLANVVRQARPLFAERTSSFDPEKERETRASVVDLVHAACETALELWRLDGAAPRAAAGDAAVSGDLSVRYQRARAEIVSRLRDAAATLSELYAADVEHGTPASDRVAQLAAELREDALSRSAAKSEIDALGMITHQNTTPSSVIIFRPFARSTALNAGRSTRSS